MSTIISRLLFCFILIILFFSGSHARKVHCGDVLKIETTDGNTLQGKLIGKIGDSINVRNYSLGTVTFASTDIESIYLKRKHVFAGAAIGFGVGLIIGYTEHMSNSGEMYPNFRNSKSEDFGKFAKTIGICSIAGAFLGSLFTYEKYIQFSVIPSCAVNTENNITPSINFTVAF